MLQGYEANFNIPAMMLRGYEANFNVPAMMLRGYEANFNIPATRLLGNNVPPKPRKWSKLRQKPDSAT